VNNSFKLRLPNYASPSLFALGLGKLWQLGYDVNKLKSRLDRRHDNLCAGPDFCKFGMNRGFKSFPIWVSQRPITWLNVRRHLTRDLGVGQSVWRGKGEIVGSGSLSSKVRNIHPVRRG
jgi:hypothetical protein